MRGRDDFKGSENFPRLGRRRLSKSRNYKSSGRRNSPPTWTGAGPQSAGSSPPKGVGHPAGFSSIEQWCRCFVSFRPTEMHHEEIASDF